MSYNIAIDGPAGAGKSTIARAVSNKLSFIYVDTGAMYRAMALHLIRCKIDANDRHGIIEAGENADVTIVYIDGEQQVLLNGENVTEKIRSEDVGIMASLSSAVPEIRKKLTSLQRKLALSCDVVMDGRDIGTCVLPDANLKIFLTAGTSERAKRRYDQLVEKGESPDLEQIEADIRERDERDMTRKEAPLKPAKDAVYLDTSNMSIGEVIEAILNLYRKDIDTNK